MPDNQKPIKYVVEHYTKTADRIIGVFDTFKDADEFTQRYMTKRDQSFRVQSSTTSDDGMVRHSYEIVSPPNIPEYWIYPVYYYKGDQP